MLKNVQHLHLASSEMNNQPEASMRSQSSVRVSWLVRQRQSVFTANAVCDKFHTAGCFWLRKIWKTKLNCIPNLLKKVTRSTKEIYGRKRKNRQASQDEGVQILNNEQGTLLVKRQDPVAPTHYLLTTCRYSRAVSQRQYTINWGKQQDSVVLETEGENSSRNSKFATSRQFPPKCFLQQTRKQRIQIPCRCYVVHLQGSQFSELDGNALLFRFWG